MPMHRSRAIAQAVIDRITPVLKAHGLTWEDVDLDALIADLNAAGVVRKAAAEYDRLAAAAGRTRRLIPTTQGAKPPAERTYEPASNAPEFGAALRQAVACHVDRVVSSPG